MSAPETCLLCHIDLQPDEHGYCTDCAYDLAMEQADMEAMR